MCCDQVKVSVAIASIGRPDLIKTLKSLDELDLTPNIVLQVIVGDDSADRAVERLVVGFQPQNFMLHIVKVASRNIATCRNACLDAASGKWIAFIDDDEWADPAWLTTMLTVAQQEKADAVFGKIICFYPETTPPWLVKADPIGRLRQARAGTVKTGSTGNALVRKAAIDENHLRFDERLGTTGGEDTDFFKRLHETGKHLFFTDSACVYERVLPGKATPQFLLKRMGRSGQSFALMATADMSIPRRTIFYAGAFLKMLVGYTASLAMQPFNRSEAFILQLKAAMNHGKLRHLFRRSMPEIYASDEVKGSF